MISRSPKSRASTENVPGPSNARAVATIATNAVETLDGNRLEAAAGMAEVQTPAAVTPTNTAATVVITPASSAIAISA